MLIVNADDLGARRAATEPILRAFDAGAISSASAMVWMWDSRRAAREASAAQLPVGLHLNLTAPFRDERVPEDARERQRRLLQRFAPDSWREGDPFGAAAPDPVIVRAVSDQFEAFCDQYGREPTHLDGHHHIHVHPSVLPCLPRGLPVRPVLRGVGDLDLPETERETFLRRVLRAPDACVSVHDVHPLLGGGGLGVLERARHRDLEVMVHPELADERRALGSDEWLSALSALPVGSYRDLS